MTTEVLTLRLQVPVGITEAEAHNVATDALQAARHYMVTDATEFAVLSVEIGEREAPGVVNVWRDHENGGELHVSVHAPERVLLSLDCGWWESTDDDSRRETEAAMILHPEED